jgi:protocatechuate 3,4-dioxygenase beta subunit
VTAGDSSRPLRRVLIRLAAPALGSSPRTTSTDTDGRYEFADLPAARYRLIASRSGYLELRYGQRRPLEAGKELDVAAAQHADGVDFVLPRASVISGRITDETGEPIANVNVMAARSMYFDGERRLIPTGELTRTSDTGEYRIVGLAPGTYVVLARTLERWVVEEDGREETMGYAPTYFPGTPRAAEAEKIALGVGKEAENTSFALVPGRAATISGTAFDSRGRPFQSVNVSQEIRGQGFGMFGTAANGAVAPDGTFTIRNVPPGDFKLAAATREDPPEVAIQPIVMDGMDVDNIALIGSNGGTVTGTVVTDDANVKPPPRLRIRLARRMMGQEDPTLLGVFQSSGAAQSSDDGTFTIDNVFGPARFDVSMPDGWAVKAIVAGGRDITDTSIDVRSGEPLHGVQIVLTNHIATIAGDLSDEAGAPLADGTVVVFSADRARWFDGTRFVRAVRPDQHGRYQITGLLPGDYLLAAVDYVEEGGWNEADFLESLRERAQKVAIAEGQTLTIPLKLAAR